MNPGWKDIARLPNAIRKVWETVGMLTDALKVPGG